MGNILPIHLAQDIAFTTVENVLAYVAYGYNTVAGAVTKSFAWAGQAYVGAQFIVGFGVASQEVVTISAISGTNVTFTAANTHIPGDLLMAAFFKSGTPSVPVLTQDEVLCYISDCQNDFLSKTHMVITTGTIALDAAHRLYAQPNDCIEIERISIAGIELRNSSQSDLDWTNPGWQSETGTPKKWYQDKIDNGLFGVYPQPDGIYSALAYYAQRAAQTLAWTDAFLIPDSFTYILKYGALARVWGKDGEISDPQRAAICQKRYDFGVFLALKFMEYTALAPKSSPKGSFRPMQVPAQQQQGDGINPLMFGTQGQ